MALGLAGAVVAVGGCGDRGERAAARAGGTIAVTRVIVAAPAPGAPAVLYAMVTNGAGSADSLLGLSTPGAESATLHRQASHGTMVEMRPVAGIPLPRGDTVRLSPGGLHGMLVGLGAPLSSGDSLPVTFRFAVSPPITVTAHVVGYAQLERALDPAGHEES